MNNKLKSMSMVILAISLLQLPLMAMTENQFRIETVCAEEPKSPIPDKITINKASVKEVDAKNNRVIILPDGMEDRVENYIVLNAGEQTSVRDKNNQPINLEDLKEGMNVKVVHAAIMQPSIPPQTPVYQITILGD